MTKRTQVSRRTSFSVLFSIGMLLGAVWAYARLIAPTWLEVVRLRIALPGLPQAWEGVRIAHLSDFHAGGAIPLTFLQRARALALADRPDVIALTGDFYDEGRVSETGDLFTAWPADVPIVAVLGNHDHRATIEDRRYLERMLNSAGVELLSNRSVRVDLRGRPAWIVGVDDPYSMMMDETEAFGTLPNGIDALIYLAHSPVAARTLPVGRARLMLAGHTHGGQLRVTRDGRVPFVALARKLRGNQPRPDPDLHQGIHWWRGAVLVISNGLGVSKLPMRFRTRPQLVLIELGRTSEDGPACDEMSRYVERLNPEPLWKRLLS